MTQLQDDVTEAKQKYESAFNKIKKASFVTAKDDLVAEITEYSGEFKKSSEEFKYISKLLKAFEDKDYDYIKSFIEDNYDRHEQMINIIKSFDENFDEKEINKYHARHRVLAKCIIAIIENGI